MRTHDAKVRDTWGGMTEGRCWRRDSSREERGGGEDEPGDSAAREGGTKASVFECTTYRNGGCPVPVWRSLACSVAVI